LLPREKREEGGRIPRLYDLPNAAGDFMGRDPPTGFSSWKIAGNTAGKAAAKVALKDMPIPHMHADAPNHRLITGDAHVTNSHLTCIDTLPALTHG